MEDFNAGFWDHGEPAYGAVREYCNVVRRCHGTVEIERLVAGIAGDEAECLVARSVNCGLRVHPGARVKADDVRDGEVRATTLADGCVAVWALVGDAEHAELLARVAAETGSRVVERVVPVGGGLAVPVPRYVAECAIAFDEEELDEEYYEYLSSDEDDECDLDDEYELVED